MAPQIKLFGLPLGQLGQFSVRVVNFAIFFAILYFILKGALSSAFKSQGQGAGGAAEPGREGQG